MIRRLLLAAALLAAVPARAQAMDDRFAAEIAAFEREDAAAPQTPGLTLFVGSSSIRLWKTLADDLAPLPVRNRGFGGSRIEDVNRHFERVVARHRPAAIVFYCGDNDLLSRPPETVLADLEVFLILKDRSLGGVPVYFMTVKPSPARAALLPAQRRLNALVEALAARRRDLRVIDVATPMLNLEGQARGELFGPDGLHLNAKGYALWRGVVRSAVGLDPQGVRP